MTLDDGLGEQISDTGDRIAELVEMLQRTALDYREAEQDRMIEIARLAARMHAKVEEIEAMVEVEELVA